MEEKRYCRKCGAELGENEKGKLCASCKKKRKKTVRVVKAVTGAAAVTAAGVYTWNQQPEFVKNMVKKAVKSGVDKARTDVDAKVKGAEVKGQVLLKEGAKFGRDFVNRTGVKKF